MNTYKDLPKLYSDFKTKKIERLNIIEKSIFL